MGGAEGRGELRTREPKGVVALSTDGVLASRFELSGVCTPPRLTVSITTSGGADAERVSIFHSADSEVDAAACVKRRVDFV